VDKPDIPLKHADTAIALIAMCLDVSDDGNPSEALHTHIHDIPTDEVVELLAALAMIGAALAAAASQVSTMLAIRAGVGADGMTPEEILARIHAVTTEPQ
jgi:hypothetical protein